MENENKNELGLKQKVDKLFDALVVENKKTKRKMIKLPRKARVSKRKFRKGYIGILKIEENGNISLEKQQISGSSFQTKDGFYHATYGKERLNWMGKYPVMIQLSWKKNPLQIRKDGEKNEVYGQKNIQAKMLNDIIKPKRSGNFIIWLLIIGGIVFGASQFFK